MKTNQKETELKYRKAKELYDSGMSQKEIAKLFNMKQNSLSIGMRQRFGLMPKGKRIKEEITQKQKELLFGSLLGDGFLNFKYKDEKVLGNFRFIEEHGEKQEEYLRYKGEILKNLLSKSGISCRERIDTRFKNPNYKIFTLRTRAILDLEDFYNMFYNKRKKIVPKDLTLLTPFALAIWFMDDGCDHFPGYKLSTNNFSKEEVIRLSKYLKNKYLLDTTINNKNEIYIKSNSARLFTSLIQEYVIDSMKYKLHVY